MLLADLTLQLGPIAAWLTLGLLAGWMAGKVMEEASYGVLGDLLLGMAGALLCGAGFGFFVTGEPSFWAGALVALIGGSLVIGVVRFIVLRREA